MTHETKEYTLAEMQLRRREAAYLMQCETALAESNVRRSDARIHDWRAVRLAETLLQYWDERCAQAEATLIRYAEEGKGSVTNDEADG